MKANELRIGNLIQTNEGKLTKVTGQTIYEGTEGFFNGVPITENRLIQFGYIKQDNFFDTEDMDMALTWCMLPKNHSEYYEGYKLYVNHEYDEGVPIKYVHQLQNLYFAITGNELQLIDQ